MSKNADYRIDIAVALIFFNRYDTLFKVFERIREARPSKLFLIQDGPRVQIEEDYKSVIKCREIEKLIDWDCVVRKNYSNQNMGCGKRVSSGISWVFEYVDRAVILEDDCVVEPTFFEFANQLLDRYENDERVCMISALNHFNQWDCGNNSYFFAKTGAIAAWATWKRVWDQMDMSVSDIDDEYGQKIIAQSFHHKRAAKKRIDNWKYIYESNRRGESVKYWGSQFGFLKYKNNSLAIVPSHSLSSNIGVGDKATFSGGGIKMMKKNMRGWFLQNTTPISFPLVHPKIVLPDEEYDMRYYHITYPNELHRIVDKIIYAAKKYIVYRRK